MVILDLDKKHTLHHTMVTANSILLVEACQEVGRVGGLPCQGASASPEACPEEGPSLEAWAFPEACRGVGPSLGGTSCRGGEGACHQGETFPEDGASAGQPSALRLHT